MITVMSCTNRAGSRSALVAKEYRKILTEKINDRDIRFVDLAEDLPTDFIRSDMYGNPTESIETFQKEVLFPSDAYVFVVPEYNGVFPGIFKLMIDAVDIKQAFYNKKAALVGVSSGRSGNLRGLDALTNALNYLHMQIFWNKLPISSIENLIGDDDTLNHADTLKVIGQQIDGMKTFFS